MRTSVESMKRAVASKLFVVAGLLLLAALMFHWQADNAHDLIPHFQPPYGSYTPFDYEDRYAQWTADSDPFRQRWLTLRGTRDLLIMASLFVLSSYFSVTLITFSTTVVCVLSWLVLYLAEVYALGLYAVEYRATWIQTISSGRYAIVTSLDPQGFLMFLVPAICSHLFLYDARRGQIAVLGLVVLLGLFDISQFLQFEGRETRNGCEGCEDSIYIQYAVVISVCIIASAYRLYRLKFKRP